MNGLLKDGLWLVDLELGLEVVDVVGEGAAVGAAASVGKGEAMVDDLFAEATPVALTTAVLLDLLGVNIGVAVLGEEARLMLNGDGSALGDAFVVAVVGLVGTSHIGRWVATRNVCDECRVKR